MLDCMDSSSDPKLDVFIMELNESTSGSVRGQSHPLPLMSVLVPRSESGTPAPNRSQRIWSNFAEKSGRDTGLWFLRKQSRAKWLSSVPQSPVCISESVWYIDYQTVGLCLRGSLVDFG